jgi:hypothetical protein
VFQNSFNSVFGSNETDFQTLRLPSLSEKAASFHGPINRLNSYMTEKKTLVKQSARSGSKPLGILDPAKIGTMPLSISNLSTGSYRIGFYQFEINKIVFPSLIKICFNNVL